MNQQPRTIGIFYFSGTGNTKMIVELLATEFERYGSVVDVIAIDELMKTNKTAEVEKYDIIGFGYPVHAFNAPRIFFEFIELLRDGKQKKTFIFKSSGDPFMQGGSTALVRKALQKKGYDVIYERLFVMPANVLVRYQDRLIKQLCNTAVQRAKTMVKEILSEITKLQKNTFFSNFLTAAFSSIENYGARFFGKNLYVSDSCNLCGICISNCPTNNITKQKGHIIFHSKCTLCMRCIYRCPANAISPHFLKFFVISPWYEIQTIVDNPAIKDACISSKTKGFFRHFNRYFSEQ
ncbi:MAG: EFR1 family ferrodoxin [Euryarchaeota archaeon]|nr:EFR1 family ferrodoxin [Euryarchaeota archaeon]